MIICVCKAINERTIRRAVADGHDTFDALQFELGVGSCCGKCVAAACEVLCEARVDAVDEQLNAVTSSPLRFVPRPSSREVALA